MATLLQIQDLVKEYVDGDTITRALDGINFNVNKGEFVAIMGPSGSGKSTLLHMLGFLDSPTSGQYIFDGINTHELVEEDVAKLRSRKVGFVFQAFNLLAKTSVLENVKLPLLYSDIPEHEWNDRAKKAIDSVGLTHRLYHEPSELSGGEKQRVAIARALINDPEIIFADEPTGNLDSTSGKKVMSILEDLHDNKGHTIILITHETHTAEHAERIIRILDGKVEKDEKVLNKRSSTDNFLK